MFLLKADELSDCLACPAFFRRDQRQSGAVEGLAILINVVGGTNRVSDIDRCAVNHGEQRDYGTPHPLTSFPQSRRCH